MKNSAIPAHASELYPNKIFMKAFFRDLVTFANLHENKMTGENFPIYSMCSWLKQILKLDNRR